MRAIMASLQPKWCELITLWKKTGEIRKTKPKLDTPFKVYIYCTKAKERFSVGAGLYATNDTLYRLPTGEIKLGDGFELWGDWSGQYDKSNFLNGKVIGEFICDSIKTYESEFVDDDCQESITRIDSENEAVFTEWTNDDDCSYDSTDLYKETCVTYDELKKYVGIGFNKFYVWHISDLVIYDKPKELGDFYRKCEEMRCEVCKHLKYQHVNADELDYDCEFAGGNIPFTRPPQSWCYVSEIDELLIREQEQTVR